MYACKPNTLPVVPEHVHCKLQYFLYYLNRVIIIIFTTTIQLYVDMNMIDGALVYGRAFALQIYFKNVDKSLLTFKNMYEFTFLEYESEEAQ